MNRITYFLRQAVIATIALASLAGISAAGDRPELMTSLDGATPHAEGTSNGVNVAQVKAANTTTQATSVMDAIKADMTLNEAPLLGVSGTAGWHKRAVMSMGGKPRGDNSPSWWRPNNLAYKSSTPWEAIAMWFVIFKGVDNRATNVRVKISDMAIYVLKQSTNKWEKLNTSDNPAWANLYASSLTTQGRIATAAPRTEPDGKLSYKFTETSHAIHGGLAKFALRGLGGADVVAAFARLTTELILDNPAGIDDRDSAQLLVSVGADYYPTMTTKVEDYTPMTYAPNVAASRFGLVKSTPRVHYFATIDPPGQEKDVSAYPRAGGVCAIPVAQFEANPPPGVAAP